MRLDYTVGSVRAINCGRRPAKLISFPVNQNCELYLARRATLIVVASVEFRVRPVSRANKSMIRNSLVSRPSRIEGSLRFDRRTAVEFQPAFLPLRTTPVAFSAG